MAGITPQGEQGKTIQLFRVDPSQGDSILDSTTLEWGEPLYNDSDDTLRIGKETSRPTASLPVFKAVPNALKENIGFATKETNGMGQLKTQDQSVVYPYKKVWINSQLIDTSTVTWYKIDGSGRMSSKTIPSSDTITFPRAIQISVQGMTSSVRPDLDLVPSTQARRFVNTYKLEQKAFGCIMKGSYTDTNKIVLIFSAIPAVTFSISLTSG